MNVKNNWTIVKNRYRLSTIIQMNFELSFPKYLIGKCKCTINKQTLDFEYCTLRLSDPVEMTIDFPWSKEFTDTIQGKTLFDILE